jgi:hypothetical protein
LQVSSYFQNGREEFYLDLRPQYIDDEVMNPFLNVVTGSLFASLFSSIFVESKFEWSFVVTIKPLSNQFVS